MNSTKKYVLSTGIITLFTFIVPNILNAQTYDFDNQGVIYSIGTDGNKVTVGTQTPAISFGANAGYLQVSGSSASWLVAGSSTKYSYFANATWGTGLGFPNDGQFIFESSGTVMTVHSYANGNTQAGLSINTSSLPDGYHLSVAGKIITEGVKVISQTNWPDYVFEDDYHLPSIYDVEDFITRNGHLQNIPSAVAIENEGFSLGEMDAKLLSKIEELTLYTIGQEKKIDELENKIEVLTKLIEELQNN